ncbi:hypothetical protein [Nocardiopsis sp. CNT312]|uniref:hypothetical protein n=1 Tax=Nocardiopsis sp. CNT312 TaxID=1137268 RepID=UPI00048CB345|nr:hypothetical protein [Nocardiopsis sp. CNT312]
MRSRTSTVRRGAVVSGCLLVLLLPAACTLAPGGEPVLTEPSASPAPARAGTPEEEAVLAAYTGMWDAVVTASHEGTGGSDALERHAVGGALALMTEALQGAVTAGADVSGEPVLAPEALVESSDRAQVTDCLDDTSWGFASQPAVGVGPRLVEARLIHDGLAWRVSDLRIWEPGTC